MDDNKNDNLESRRTAMSRLTYIFVHGLSGWGSYDAAYRWIPYWGMRCGDLIAFLREKGFECYAASVAPTGSAWDRACELYAQLAGTRVDYGEVHSQTFHHERYGRDFSGCPLIPAWNDGTKLVLLGHSFGGTTVRLFSELLAHGDTKEQHAVPARELSPFFAGGRAGCIHSLVTLASPMNGTTAYNLFEDPSFDPAGVHVPRRSRMLARMMAIGTSPKRDGRDEQDYADHDMHLDRAGELNRRMAVLPDIYYFSVPCSLTEKAQDGTYRPKRGMEPLFVLRANQIGAYIGRTAGGITVDESWRENDGLVNTSSARFPTGAPFQQLNRDHIQPGIWNVFPTVKGDHMWPQGGLLHRHDIRAFYLDMLSMIDGLETKIDREN